MSIVFFLFRLKTAKLRQTLHFRFKTRVKQHNTKNKMCKKCCCDICTCVSRVHSCIPYEKHVTIPFQGQSTMKEAFQAWQIPKQGLNQQKINATKTHVKKMKFNATSSYKDEFTVKPLDKSRTYGNSNPNIKANYFQNPIKFDAHSSYSTQFTPKDIPKRPKTSYGDRKGGSQYLGHKFEAQSLYKEQYTPKQLYKVKSYAPRPMTADKLSRSGPKFEGVSSYQSEFVRKPLSRKSSERNIQAKRPTGNFGLPFDGTSTYKINFTPKQMDNNRPCPVVFHKLDRKAMKNQKHRFYKQQGGKWVAP